MLAQPVQLGTKVRFGHSGLQFSAKVKSVPTEEPSGLKRYYKEEMRAW